MKRPPSLIAPLPKRGFGIDSARRRRAREALARVIWDSDGGRRLPRQRELARAIAACEPRDVWWVCEASAVGAVYFLPTREWVKAMAKHLHALKATRVLEVGAGDGFLTSVLAPALLRLNPRARVVASDSHGWKRARARQSTADQRRFANVTFAGVQPAAHVHKLAASTAVARVRPDVVLVSWAPPGLMVERCIRGPCKYVVDISVDGDVCGNGTRTWRFHKEFIESRVATLGLCRLDGKGVETQTRITQYFGARHRSFGVEHPTARGGGVLWSA